MFHSGTAAAVRRLMADETGAGPADFGIVATGLGLFVVSAIWFLGGEIWRTVIAKILSAF